MNTNENLVGVTQKFITPDIVQKFSQSIDEPTDKTQKALNTVIPTLLMGIVDKASTTNGAEKIIAMMKKHEVEGDKALQDIFGKNLNNIIDRLKKTTMLNPLSITKMLGLAVPMVLGAIETKVKRENLNSSGLQKFLKGNPPEHKEHHFNRSWGKIVLIILLAFGAITWMTSSGLDKSTITPPSEVLTPDINSQTVIPSIRELPGFLVTAKARDVPHTFQFEFINFEAGSSKLAQGSDDEIDQIAVTLERHPKVAIRLEGFSDNSRDVLLNKDLSFQRAQAVKEELVERGINPDRVDTVANTSGTNRVSLVVTSVE